ncbi:MAG: copper chaperone PCu(A)C [Deltaproteobacteria bacterium]|nr:copper chaperone PCu(A)C [Deltaproteobacteria bacterium]
MKLVVAVVASALVLPVAAAAEAPPVVVASPQATLAPPATAATAPAPGSAGRCAALSVVDAWVRVLPPGAKNTAAFARLKNASAVDVVVTGAQSPIARRAELHGTSMKSGVMRMYAVERVVVPAGGEAVLAPGGLHVMLFDQTAPRPGDAVTLTLSCDDGSRQTTTALASARAPTVAPSVAPQAGP